MFLGRPDGPCSREAPCSSDDVDNGGRSGPGVHLNTRISSAKTPVFLIHADGRKCSATKRRSATLLWLFMTGQTVEEEKEGEKKRQVHPGSGNQLPK